MAFPYYLVQPCQFPTEGEFEFIPETLRPAGLPREGPFVWWFSRFEDATDFEDSTGFVDTKDLEQ